MNPGSDAAILAGCTCPVADNGYGQGAWMSPDGAVFWTDGDCPLHGASAEVRAGSRPLTQDEENSVWGCGR